MRLRTDDWWMAGFKRAVFCGARPDPRSIPPESGRWDGDLIGKLDDPAFEPAQDGDAWEIRWHVAEGRGLFAGYALTCPDTSCDEGVHLWTSAANCPSDDRGICGHSGKGSCWDWTGSVEAGDLSASPSLHAEGARCGWHGFLAEGRMERA